MSDTNNKPLETLRRGSLKIAIWANPITGGGTRYSTDGVIRSYRDDQDQWHETRSLSAGELLQASRLMAQADDRIVELKVSARRD